MKRRRKNPISRRLRLVMYSMVICLLVASSIYQVYSIWSSLSEKKVISGKPGKYSRDPSASLLTPFEMYLTLGDERYVRIQETSGYYTELEELSGALLKHMAAEGKTPTAVPESELPSGHAILVLKYAYSLEKTALQEILEVDVGEDASFQEIWIQPAIARQEQPVWYLLNWEQEQFYCIESNLSWNHTANSNFCNAFFAVGDSAEATYLEGHRSFPETFAGGNYVLQQEREYILYDIGLEPAFTGEAGAFDEKAAYEYAMHFFEYPDVVKTIGGDSLWYADEKRTVRMDSSGLLQYVETPEKNQQESLTLTEAYQLAMGFLEADLDSDETRLLEVYLEEYIVEDGTYTFYWNYKFDNIPFHMEEDKREAWDLSYPVQITVEGSVVRYYQRYIVNKSMQPDRMRCVKISYMDALDRCREDGIMESVQSMSLVYQETQGTLELSWRIMLEDQWYSVPTGGETS